MTGVRAVLVEKLKNGRPSWSPPTLEEVSQSDVVNKFFKKYSPAQGNAPALAVSEDLVPKDYKIAHPMRWALPTEEEIGKMVTGSHPSSGSTQITSAELVKKFEDLRNHKNGVREKVLEVVQRRCKEVEDKTSGMKYLAWVR